MGMRGTCHSSRQDSSIFGVVTLHPFDNGNGRIVGDLLLACADGSAHNIRYPKWIALAKERRVWQGLRSRGAQGRDCGVCADDEGQAGILSGFPVTSMRKKARFVAPNTRDRDGLWSGMSSPSKELMRLRNT